ncbi:procathepsin L-like [Sitodiplosis mosellana]|uniref:procathepsin L-like n=1 Tax=Sitodiplosis mosellana TaxID=263140 RepID=UPI002443E8A8|nr:procathepsin L-like [Sitodiplosis mosellana]
MNTFLIIFACVFAIVSVSSSNLSEWNAFKTNFGKKYKNQADERHHMRIFLKHKDEVEKHNQMFNDGLVSYTMSLNSYSDVEHSDFAASMRETKHIRSQAPMRNKTIDEPQLMSFASVKLPQSVDWRKKGAVSAVKKQGICGACWAFSVAGTLEAQKFRKTGRLVPLSAQHLIDCITDDDDDKCDGNLIHNAFDYIKRNGGLQTEQSYPYRGFGSTCKKNRRHVAATLRSYRDLPDGDEMRLQQAIANIGPLSVSLDAMRPSFQFYSGGIYYDRRCRSRNRDLNHAMLVVGYGTDKRGKEYYIIKNSWGTEWGENGYMRLARNRKNHCGIATEATYPVI